MSLFIFFNEINKAERTSNENSHKRFIVFFVLYHTASLKPKFEAGAEAWETVRDFGGAEFFFVNSNIF
jgi:hypothetical protein